VQFISRGLLPAGTDFQSREQAEYYDRRSYNAECDTAAGTQPWRDKEASHGNLPVPPAARVGIGSFTPLPLTNSFESILPSHLHRLDANDA
jgi:hypothetical protein